MATVLEQTDLLLEKRDFQGVSDLIDKYRDFETVIHAISTCVASHNPVRTPSEAADKNLMAMMENLKDTSFMKEEGNRLSAVPTEKANGIHALFAMYTFMLSAYLDKHPQSDIPRPELKEVYSAKRILNHCRKERDGNELAMLAVVGIEPSEYVKIKYQLAEDYLPYNRIRQGKDFEHALSGKAAAILEQKFKNNLPEKFVAAMKHDREVLRAFAVKPDSNRHLRIRMPCNAFDLLSRETPEERLVRIAKAYDHLDKRIARMTDNRLQLPLHPFISRILFDEAVRRKDYSSLYDLVHLNGKNVPLIKEWTGQLAQAPFFRDVRETGNPSVGSLITQLNITRYGQETGTIPAGKDKEVSPLHLINAYYTVMRHEHSVCYGGKTLPLPTPEELQAAVKVLDGARRGNDRDELRRTAAGVDEPSDYVKVRYGLSDSYQKVSSLLHLAAKEALADRFPSASSLKEKADKMQENIRQMAGNLAQGISEGKMPPNPLDALRNDKEMLDILTYKYWGEYAVPDRNFQLKYGFAGYFDAIGRIEQRRQGEPDLKEHLDFLTSQQVNMIQFEASHEGERLGDKLSYLEYRRNKDIQKQDEGIRQKEPVRQERELSPKQKKPTF